MTYWHKMWNFNCYGKMFRSFLKIRCQYWNFGASENSVKVPWNYFNSRETSVLSLSRWEKAMSKSQPSTAFWVFFINVASARCFPKVLLTVRESTALLKINPYSSMEAWRLSDEGGMGAPGGSRVQSWSSDEGRRDCSLTSFRSIISVTECNGRRLIV